MAEADQVLVVQTLNGRLDAFGLLVERYSGLVWALILERVRRGDEIEDLVQETFCTAYQALPDLRDPSRFAPWLCRIARNTALHWTRQEQCRLRAEDGAPNSTSLPDPEEALAATEQDQAVWQALDALPEQVRQLVVLRHLEGCTYRDLARFLGISITAVRWRLLRAEQQVTRGLVQLLRAGVQARCPDRPRLRRRVLAGLSATLPLAPRSEALTLSWWSLSHLLPALKTAVPALVGVGTAGTLVAHLAGLSLPGWPADSESADRIAVAAVAQDSLIRVQLAPLPALPGPAGCEPPASPPDPRRLTALSVVEVAAASGAESTVVAPGMLIAPAVPTAAPGEKSVSRLAEPERTHGDGRTVQVSVISYELASRIYDLFPEAIPNLFAYCQTVPDLNLQGQWRLQTLLEPPATSREVSLLYLTGGWVSLRLNDLQRKNLGAFLRQGVLLFAEEIRHSHGPDGLVGSGAGRTRTGFDMEFKRLMCDQLVLGLEGQQWEKIPRSHPLYSCYFELPDGPPRGGAPGGTVVDLEMLQLRGRPAVIFSDLNISWYWGDPECRNRKPGLQFGVNLLVFALTRGLAP